MNNPIKLNTPFSFKSLVKCKKGKIVRQAITLSSQFKVIVMALWKCELPSHESTNDILIQVLKGEGTITVKETKKTVKKGDVIVISANESHGIAAKGKLKIALFMPSDNKIKFITDTPFAQEGKTPHPKA